MTEPPETCAVAYKEWSGVCDALADGRQSLLLRKGGIAEGPAGFSPEHPAFWLYPTRLHEAQQGLKEEAGGRAGTTPPGFVDLSVLAVVRDVVRLDREDTLDRLDSLHVWTEETIRKRFRYREPGLWLLVVRAFRRPEPWRIEVTPEHSGCKTWVPLVEPLPTTGLGLVLDEPRWRLGEERIRAALASSPSAGPAEHP